jgi:hypothetical protein
MIKIEKITENIVRVTLPETLKSYDFVQLAPQIEAAMKHGKISLLVDATNFNGWENIQSFEKHIRFVKSHHNHVERIAIIAGHNWQHWLAGMLKIFVNPEVRVFDKEEASEVMEWITS